MRAQTSAAGSDRGTVEPDPQRPAQGPALPLHMYFASTIALITSYADGKGSNVMACEWTTNVCYRPLRIMSLIGCNDYTHQLITASGEFGVNLCSTDQVALSSYAGNTSGRQVHKLAADVFADHLCPPKRIKAPMLNGCVLNVECVVEQTFEIGEHTAFIGRAVAGRYFPDRQPLLYHRGRYFGLGPPVERSER